MRARPRHWVIAIVSVLALGGGVAAITAWLRAGERTGLPQRLPLTQVNVSRAPGAQLEAAIAVAPSDPEVLLAGSNDVGPRAFDTLAYASADGGRSWVTSHPYAGPGCAIGDPAVAIDESGRELFAYLTAPCRARSDEKPIAVYVSTREQRGGDWSSVQVAGPLETGANDKPTLALDLSPASPYRGRAYLGWGRILSRRSAELVVVHSDDGGRTWSQPVRVEPSQASTSELFASLGVAPDGDLYVVRTDISHGVFLSRSTDGGASFDAAVVVEASVFFPNVCRSLTIATEIPAQSRRCVTPTPTVAARASGVTVVYAEPSASAQDLDVFARNYDRALRPRGGTLRVNPPDGGTASDQFQPTATIDAATGLIWVCFYDTRGDRTRRTARFSCTASREGFRWKRPLRVASTPSDETRTTASKYQYGDYQGLAIGRDGIAHPIWTDSRNLAEMNEEIYTTRLTAANLGYGRLPPRR
jgi:hypothetical protein